MVHVLCEEVGVWSGDWGCIGSSAISLVHAGGAASRGSPSLRGVYFRGLSLYIG